MKELTDSIIQKLFLKTGVDEKYYSYYETDLKNRFKDFRKTYPYEEDLDEEERAEDEKMEKACIECANDYIRHYVEEAEKGHGHKWAHFYALGCISGDEVEDWINNVQFDDSNEKDRELTIHAKSINEDPIFVERFKNLAEWGSCNINEKAEEYCSAYHNCVEDGKSETYAHAYAEAVNDDSNYCDIYASASEQAKFYGMSNSEARMFGDCCAETYANAWFLGNKDFFYTFGEEWQKEYYLKLWYQRLEDDNHRKLTDWEHQKYRDLLEEDIKCLKFLNKL
jgi:hypothetical protein